jgi:hypothetical protein
MDIKKLEICGQRLEREQYGNLTRIPRFWGYYTVRGNKNFLEKLELTTPRAYFDTPSSKLKREWKCTRTLNICLNSLRVLGMTPPF